jgi:hypothetical protein
MVDVGVLVCGRPEVTGIAKSTLDHLNSSISRFAERSLTYLTGEFDEETQLYGAFCTRVLIELGCAALLGRIDPFRIMYLSEYQAQASYQYGRTARSAFRWAGDVMTEDRPSGDLWSGDQDPPKISRALLSPYSDHLFWKPGLERALNHIDENGHLALAEIKGRDPDRFVVRTKGQMQSLYSTLSKGVHWEFFTSGIIMDEVTLKEGIKDAFSLIGGLALVSHFIPTAVGCLPADEAVNTYISLKEATL